MMPFQIRPDQALQEIQEFNTKLAHGLKTLSEIGEIDVGVTPKEGVYFEDKLTLYRFKPRTERACNPIPVLIVYALVNRPYIADLQEGRSMVQGLLDAGLDVYLIDWGYPDGADKFLTLTDYIDGYIDRCVDVIRRRHGLEAINLLGICQGGTFSLCYTALHMQKVRNLITTVTPVDFHTPMDLLSHWVRKVDVDLMVDTMGNIPGELLNWTFVSLKPFRLMGQKYMDLVNMLDDPEKAKNFMRMEKWIFDSPDQAGEAFRQFTKDFYQQNGLIKGTVKIGDRNVDLKDITVPVLNIYAAADHLVPPASSIALKEYVGTKDYTVLEFPGGHIGIYVSGKAQGMVPPAIGEWLDERT
ncbi:MAG: class III poly(R)-hydroxyalkanoic acid synthase subunit PhaC [Gammaproteobacteria bacterium]